MPRSRNARWPEHADNHRIDALAAALEIESLVRSAQEAAAVGRNLEASVLLQRIGRRAASIRAAMLLARAGLPSDRDDPHTPDDMDVLEQVEQALGGRP